MWVRLEADTLLPP
jgi:hypothetical protein